MTVAYVDSSALVKLVLAEPGRDDVVTLWDAADAVVTSGLAHPEVVSALAAARRARRLEPEGYAEALRQWDRYRPALRLIELTAAVADLAGELVETNTLSGADAVHLASALQLAEGPLVLATFDARLHDAARASGIATLLATV